MEKRPRHPFALHPVGLMGELMAGRPAAPAAEDALPEPEPAAEPQRLRGRLLAAVPRRRRARPLAAPGR